MAPSISKRLLTLVWLLLGMTWIPVAGVAAQDVHVGQIQALSDKNGTDKVCFVLKPFCDPKVFSIEGDRPRIVVDIENVQAWVDTPTVLLNGPSIRQVRSHLHREQNKLRIVLDLTPSRDYTAEPVYYESEGIYCIAVGTK